MSDDSYHRTHLDWKPVGAALMGSWPSQVAAWGREALAAYLGELRARGLTPDTALAAIRSVPDGKFPPSAPELAAIARQDPDRPTFDELLAQLYGPGGVFGFKRSNVTISPWVEAFVRVHGRDRLRLLEIDHPVEGGFRRHALGQAWTAFLEANESRQAAEIAARRGDGLQRFNPPGPIRRRVAGELEAGR